MLLWHAADTTSNAKHVLYQGNAMEDQSCSSRIGACMGSKAADGKTQYSMPGPDPFTKNAMSASAAVWVPGTTWCVVVDFPVQQFLDVLPYTLSAKNVDTTLSTREQRAAASSVISLDAKALNKTQCVVNFMFNDGFECFWPRVDLNVVADGVPLEAREKCFPQGCAAASIVKVGHNTYGEVEANALVLNASSECADNLRCVTLFGRAWWGGARARRRVCVLGWGVR